MHVYRKFPYYSMIMVLVVLGTVDKQSGTSTDSNIYLYVRKRDVRSQLIYTHIILCFVSIVILGHIDSK